VIADGLVIRRNKKGRAVYTTRPFKRGAIVTECTMLVWPIDQPADNFVGKYLWTWADSGVHHMREALCLGIASLFNHSNTPNTGARRLYKQTKMVFRALRDIEQGEEVVIDYGPAADEFQVIE